MAPFAHGSGVQSSRSLPAIMNNVHFITLKPRRTYIDFTVASREPRAAETRVISFGRAVLADAFVLARRERAVVELLFVAQRALMRVERHYWQCCENVKVKYR